MKTIFHLALLAATSILFSQPPNFIIILGDDINRDNIGCYGGGVQCDTPHMDRLAEDGVRFAKAYSSVAMCAPFRQELYSGRTPWRTQTFLNHSTSTADTKSLPHYLTPLGYRVALVGKRHIGPHSAYPFEFLGDTNDNKAFVRHAKEFITECLSEKAPFCLVIASNDAHAKFSNGDASAYDSDELNIPPYWVDTSELRELLPAYLAEVTNFDSLVGSIRGYLDESGLATDTLLFVCTEQGSQFPFAKWTCFDNGLATGFLAYGPGRIPSGYVSEELLWMCDVAPTIAELADAPFQQNDFDGKSQVANLKGKSTPLHEFVFGAFSNKGIINNKERIYPIRSIRDGRYSLIYSPKQDGLTSNLTLTHSLQLLENPNQKAPPLGKNNTGRIARSWVLAEGPKHPLVDKLHRRPEFALYDLENDPYELNNLIDSPEHNENFKRLKSALMEFLEENDDADPIETEVAATRKNH